MCFLLAVFLCSLPCAPAQPAPSPCVNPSCATPPCAAALEGDVGCTTVTGTQTHAHEINAANMNLPTNTHIYGPFEAGFSAMQNSIIQGWGCSTPADVYDPTGGIDLMNAEAKVAKICSLTNFPGLSGTNYIGIVGGCGGHVRDYHFHVRLDCLYSATDTGHSTKVGNVASFSLYGKHEHRVDGKLPLLDACGAHFGTNPDSTTTDVYHYHVQDYPPFTVGCHGPASGNTKMTVQGCRNLYSSGTKKCDAASDVTFEIKARSDPNGPANGAITTVNYDRWCPCWDANRKNLGTNIVELPAIACTAHNWYSGPFISTACGAGSASASFCTLSSVTGYDTSNCDAAAGVSRAATQCTLTCASGYSGTPTVSCPNHGGTFSITNPCLQSAPSPTQTSGSSTNAIVFTMVIQMGIVFQNF